MRLARASLGSHDLVDVDVQDGVIAAVAPAGTTAAPGEAIDLDGRRLVPGLWDEHVHVRTWATSSRRPSVREATSPDEVAALVRAALPSVEPGLPLVAVGMRDGLWTQQPLRSQLDAVAGDVPVIVISSDLHTTWSNAALGRLVGVDLDATGMLRDAASFAVMTRIDALVAELADAWIHEGLAEVTRRGVVGVVDLDLDDAVGAWSRRQPPPVRVDAGIYPHDLDEAEARGDATGALIQGLARVGPLKVITDGSLGTRTAYCHEPYPGTSSRGTLEVQPEQLVDLMGRGAALGLAPAIHAIGDAANALVLDAFERVGVPGRIEHAQLVAAADVSRMARLGVGASLQPEHMLDDRELVARYWPHSAAGAYRIRSLVDAGVHVVFGSDAPVTPLDPWLAMASAVTRSRGGDAPWQADEAIDVETALRCSARTAIEVGQPADLVALGDALEPERLATMPVDLTLVAGEVMHDAIR